MAFRLQVAPPTGNSFEQLFDVPSLTVGRSSRADLIIEDPVISRQHARFFVSHEDLMVEDLGSHNGTLLNGSKVIHPKKVYPGDVIKLAGSAISVLEIIGATTSGGFSQKSVFTSAAALIEQDTAHDLMVTGEKDLRQFADRMRLINDVHRAVGKHIDQGELMELILDKVFDYLNPEEGAILLRKEGAEPGVVASRNRADSRQPFYYSQNLVSEVMDQGMAALVLDLQSDERFDQAQSLMLSGVRSLIAAPLLDDTGCMGMIVLASRAKVRNFSNEDMAMLVSIASIAALRLRNLELVEESARQMLEANRALERKVAERTYQLKATNGQLQLMDQIVETINRETELNTLLQTLIEQSQVIFPLAERSSFLLCDERDRLFRFVAAVGYHMEKLAHLTFSHDQLVDCFVAQGRQLGQGIYMVGPQGENHINELPLPPIRHRLCLSIISDDLLRGFLLLDMTDPPQVLPKSELEKLARFRQHATSAVAKSYFLGELSRKNEEIYSSIRYAERIQHAILPDDQRLQEDLPEHFILWRPKDIVSGDFYWVHRTERGVLAAAIDCTGHGVPGALMSMVGQGLLDEIIRENIASDPAEILAHLHRGVRRQLKQESGNVHATDGMDMAICFIDEDYRSLTFAGAKRPLYMIRNRELIKVRGDRHSIGGHQKEDVRRFTDHQIVLQTGDMIYLTSDGFMDQPGEDRRKYGIKGFTNFLLTISHHPAALQGKLLTQELARFQGKAEQRDDITVLGLRIP